MQDSKSASHSEPETPNSGDEKPNLLQIVLSTLAAAFGVQSSKNRERDFKHGSIKVFAAAGIIFTTLFVLTLIFVVKMVLNQAGV